MAYLQDSLYIRALDLLIHWSSPEDLHPWKMPSSTDHSSRLRTRLNLPSNCLLDSTPPLIIKMYCLPTNTPRPQVQSTHNSPRENDTQHARQWLIRTAYRIRPQNVTLFLILGIALPSAVQPSNNRCNQFYPAYLLRESNQE